MSKKTQEIEQRLLPTVEALGYEIVDVTLQTGRGTTLTVYIYQKSGVGLEDCEKVHRAIDPVLDEMDPTDGRPYTLNVSSPGLDRAFTRDSDFARNMGERVEVRLYAPLPGGKRCVVGELIAYDAETFTVMAEDGERSFRRNEVAKVSYYIDF